jgi:hypothetical protein
MKVLNVFLLVLLSVSLLAQTEVPPGTLLPVMLSSSIDTKKSKTDDKIGARLMQDVPLGGKDRLPAGSHLSGHIVQVSDSRVALIFDHLTFHHHTIALRTNLRSLASMMEVNDAQLPANAISGDRGTSEYDWTTEQIGGDVVYGKRGGRVMRGHTVVGHSVLGDGVIAVPRAELGSKCGAGDDNGTPQAMWLFSASACGTYGYPDIEIADADKSEPAGTIVLVSHSRIKIRSGSGMLLRVTAE